MRVGIYYPFDPYLGGGEKYVFTLAEHLSLNRGYKVELLSGAPERVREVAKALGCDLSGVDIRSRSGYVPAREKALGSSRYDLFICVSNHAVPPVASLGRHGLLLVQFPFPTRSLDWVKAGLLGPRMLRSYSALIVYSRFVSRWVERRSPSALRAPIHVLPPPVEVPLSAPKVKRDPIILGVGRFFAGGHNKRHADLIRAFTMLKDGGLSGWELHLAGSTRPEPEHQEYLDGLRRMAEGYPVRLRTDLSREELATLYGRAAIFWHATGYGLDPAQRPEAMEHFGMATVEAMSHGAIPVVIARGGQPEILRHGVEGFLWDSLEELRHWTVHFISTSDEERARLRSAAYDRSLHYSTQAFQASLDRIIDGLEEQPKRGRALARGEDGGATQREDSLTNGEQFPLVCPIILNWNRADLTIETLDSLREQTYGRIVPVVLDNGSDDQAEELRRIRETHPEACLFGAKSNLGFARGCNAGLRVALRMGADYLMLLNNDVALHPDAIAELVATLEADPGMGAAGPLIYYASEPQRVWFGGGEVQMGGRVGAEHGEDTDARPGDPPRGSGWLPGTAIMARREAVLRAGPLDPAYFLYWEDVDWCMRLRRAGYRLLLVPGAVLWHKVNASTGALPLSLSIVYYWERNRLRFIERWGDLPTRLIAWSKILWRLLAWGVRLPPHDPQARVKLEAYRDYLLRRFGPRR